MAKKKSTVEKYKSEYEEILNKAERQLAEIDAGKDPIAALDAFQTTKDGMASELRSLSWRVSNIPRRTSDKGTLNVAVTALTGGIGIIATLASGGTIPAILLPIYLFGSFGGIGIGATIGDRIGKKQMNKIQFELAALDIQMQKLEEKIDTLINSTLDTIAENRPLMTSPSMKDLLVKHTKLTGHFFDACHRKQQTLLPPPARELRKGDDFNI